MCNVAELSLMPAAAALRFLLSVHILDTLESLGVLAPNSDHICHFFLILSILFPPPLSLF